MYTNGVGSAQNTAARAAYTAEQKNISNTPASASSQKTSPVTSGNVVGTPQLTEEGKKYYDQLRKKFSNMDFVLVSPDKKAEAQASAGRYANPNRMVVLIDTDKIEKMATDAQFRAQYEGIISGASAQLSQMKSGLAGLGSASGKVKTYGMKVNDGGNASFFAVIDNSLKLQKDRIKKNAAKKASDKKKAAKEAEEKRLEKREAQKKEKAEGADKTGWEEDGTEVTITADSVEELLQKITDYLYPDGGAGIWAEEETQVGQKIDFRA